MVNCVLISMPWAAPMRPSIQTGALKAYISSLVNGQVSITSVPAHFGILFRAAGPNYLDFFNYGEPLGEALYLALYYRTYGLGEISFDNNTYSALIDKLNDSLKTDSIETLLDRLKLATDEYIDHNICPRLSKKTINIVGLSINFSQFYSSLYCIEYLRKKHSYNFVFVTGGMTMSLPRARRILSDLSIDAYVVQGEGERRLFQIVQACIKFSSNEEVLLKEINHIEGVFHPRNPSGLKHDRCGHDRFQVRSLNGLPVPDYDDYFEELRAQCSSEHVYNQLKQSVTILAEGSRGCLFNCDFCGFNSAWSGFRSIDVDNIYNNASHLCKKYSVSRIYYVDNMCDTWAKSYAEALIKDGVRINSFMELRSKHDEKFWTALKLTGVERIQVGIEAISQRLLDVMNKKTKVIDNIKALKYLTELNIESSANLITFHPKSKDSDIEETILILKLIPHLQALNLSGFALCIGSPLYDELPPEEKKRAENIFENKHVIKELEQYFIDWRHDLPEGFGSSEVLNRKWQSFTEWYDQKKKALQGKPLHLMQENISEDAILIKDSREKCIEHKFEGGMKDLYEYGHGGPKMASINDELDISDSKKQEYLDYLVKHKLVFISEGRFLSLATRDGAALLRSYFYE